MKRPREILLARHRQAERRLEAVRREALNVAAASAGSEATLSPPVLGGLFWVALKKGWRELIWPSRRAWAGIAALWLGLLTFNLEMKVPFAGAHPARSAPPRELARALEEQRQLLVELLQTAKVPLTEPPRANPRPRSERQLMLRPC